MRVRGTVERQRVARGSKSEYDAIVLRTARRTYRLRRRGGHPFYDPTLEPLVGKTLLAEGTVAGPAFILDGWEIDAPPKRVRSQKGQSHGPA